jgi:[CysO sulfur-carrier protein]-S-L-cysteine hydrolase
MSGDTPWITGDLEIDGKVLSELHAHALECFPSECCGFVSGPADQPRWLDASERQINQADKLHENNPERFPRTSTTYFAMDALRAERAIEQGQKNGRPIKVVYHSHCNAGAYFSDEDKATFAMANTLTWPCAFIVVSVMAGKVADTKLWVHIPNSNDFRESQLTVR